VKNKKLKVHRIYEDVWNNFDFIIDLLVMKISGFSVNSDIKDVSSECSEFKTSTID